MQLRDLVAGLIAGPRNRSLLPEYRQIELYTKRKTLQFAEPEPAQDDLASRVGGVLSAFMLLDAVLESQLTLDESKPTWQRYLGLPRASATGKLVAELYRILRVARVVCFHAQGHIETVDGIVEIYGAINRVALSLEITPAGLVLLESAVAYYLDSLHQPYSEAYVEAMLAEYFFDIVSEIKRFADEDRVLYQFQRKYRFNRHFRFDCDNPKTRTCGDMLEIDIGAVHQNPALYPIDFFITASNALHIVPVEALTGDQLPLAQLERWRARLADGVTLPASFRPRFGREKFVIGQPMT